MAKAKKDIIQNDVVRQENPTILKKYIFSSNFSGLGINAVKGQIIELTIEQSENARIKPKITEVK